MTFPRIALDYTAAIHQQAGIGVSVRELTRALVEARPDAALTLFAQGTRGFALPPPPGGCHYAPSRLSERAHARLWFRLRLPLPVETWTGPIDLYHATDFALPPTRRGVKTVVTVHDLAFEHFPAETMPGMLDHLRRVVPRSVRRADRVIAVSESTRQDVIDCYRVPPEKVVAIHHGAAGRFHPRKETLEDAVIRRKYGLPRAGLLVLTVGTLQPRKNHRRLVEAFAGVTTPATLVIAGGEGWGYDDARAEATRRGLDDRVIFAGRVDDQDLPGLYRAATVFVYPSLYEGFGLPVLEAMACGTPVVASNTSSLPEVTGGDALLVTPTRPDDIAAAITRLLDDELLWTDLRDRALARARRFTWEAAARQTWDVYRSLVGGL